MHHAAGRWAVRTRPAAAAAAASAPGKEGGGEGRAARGAAVEGGSGGGEEGDEVCGEVQGHEVACRRDPRVAVTRVSAPKVSVTISVAGTSSSFEGGNMACTRAHAHGRAARARRRRLPSTSRGCGLASVS